jgi:hypothetical protein
MIRATACIPKIPNTWKKVKAITRIKYWSFLRAGRQRHLTLKFTTKPNKPLFKLSYWQAIVYKNIYL